ncbi:MAG: GWxTD domain-containing protein [Acidobacteriota bacterium]
MVRISTRPAARTPNHPSHTQRCARLFLVLLLLSECRILNRPNPQLPPEFQASQGPTAAAASLASSGAALEKEPAWLTAGETEPEPAEGDQPAGISLATRTQVPSPGPSLVLPVAPLPGEGKSTRLLMEAPSGPPGARDLTPLPDDPEFRRALRQWDNGPVRYIILKEEQDLFRQLETDEDRIRFIQDFWARRDRSPETSQNEYRLEFWQRVGEANRRFIDQPQPGWKTDRGRIWIVMGPPDDTENFAFRRKGSGVLRWFYRKRPNLYLEPNFVVAFRVNFAGFWELSNDPRDFDPVFRDLESSVRPFFPSNSLQAAVLPKNFGQKIDLPTTNLLNLFLDLGRAVMSPEVYRIQDKQAAVQSREIFGTMDLRTAFDFLGPAQGDKIRTGITLGILKGTLVSETNDDEADSNLAIDLSLYSGKEEDADRVIRISERFGPSHENYVLPLSRRLLYRTEVALDPGTYLAVYRLLDRTSGQSAQARETFTVPDRFWGDLELSTIILAWRLVAVDPATERRDAFTLGRYRIVPNLESTYRNGDTLAFYYRVNGASFDPRTGRRRLDVEYSFAVRQEEGWLPIGEPLAYRDLENPQGWSAPLSQWPPATYRLTVKVTDVVRGESVRKAAYFRVLPGS